MPESNACQLVLKYMLIKKTIFVKAYHDRLYFYSSGTKFGMIVGPLQDWQHTHERALRNFDGDVNEKPPNPKTLLKRLATDYAGMHELIADAILNFMKYKPQPYGSAYVYQYVRLRAFEECIRYLIMFVYVVKNFRLRQYFILECVVSRICGPTIPDTILADSSFQTCDDFRVLHEVPFGL